MVHDQDVFVFATFPLLVLHAWIPIPLHTHTTAHLHVYTWCIVATTVLPAAASDFKVSHTLYAVYVSSPEVGSSRKRIEGLVISCIAIEVRLRSPPEIPAFSPDIPTIVSAHLHTLKDHQYARPVWSSKSTCMPTRVYKVQIFFW